MKECEPKAVRSGLEVAGGGVKVLQVRSEGVLERVLEVVQLEEELQVEDVKFEIEDVTNDFVGKE